MMKKVRAKKKKIYVLTLSQFFPKGHIHAGEETFFREKLALGLHGRGVRGGKFHTIRANYELWRKRFEKIAADKAVLSIRQWVGKPYAEGSTQREIVTLTRDDGIGLQRLDFEGGDIYCVNVDGQRFSPTRETLENIAANDGLSYEDWREWFKDYDISNPLAIIQFTKYRY